MTDPTYPERIFATATRAKGPTGQIGTWREADDGTGRVEYVRADLVDEDFLTVTGEIPSVEELLNYFQRESDVLRDIPFMVVPESKD